MARLAAAGRGMARGSGRAVRYAPGPAWAGVVWARGALTAAQPVLPGRAHGRAQRHGELELLVELHGARRPLPSPGSVSPPPSPVRRPALAGAVARGSLAAGFDVPRGGGQWSTWPPQDRDRAHCVRLSASPYAAAALHGRVDINGAGRARRGTLLNGEHSGASGPGRNRLQLRDNFLPNNAPILSAAQPIIGQPPDNLRTARAFPAWGADKPSADGHRTVILK